jgi:hypothetical protein
LHGPLPFGRGLFHCRFPKDTIDAVAARGNYEVQYLDAAVVRQQQSIADTFSKLGLIPPTVKGRDTVWTPNGKLASAGSWVRH